MAACAFVVETMGRVTLLLLAELVLHCACLARKASEVFLADCACAGYTN